MGDSVVWAGKTPGRINTISCVITSFVFMTAYCIPCIQNKHHTLSINKLTLCESQNACFDNSRWWDAVKVNTRKLTPPTLLCMCSTEKQVVNKTNDMSSENCDLEGNVRRYYLGVAAAEQTVKICSVAPLMWLCPHISPKTHRHSTSRANNSDCPPQDPAQSPSSTWPTLYAQRPNRMTLSSVDPASARSTEGGHQPKQPHVHILYAARASIPHSRTVSILREQLLCNPRR